MSNTWAIRVGSSAERREVVAERVRPAVGVEANRRGDPLEHVVAAHEDPVTGEGIYYALRSAELFADAYLEGKLEEYESRWRKDFGAELRRASRMRRRFYGNFWGAPFTERMIEFARGHRGVKRVLGDLVAGEQGYTDLKKKLAKSALRPI